VAGFLVSLFVVSSESARDCLSHPISGATVKPGYCVYTYASIAGARGIDVAPNGDLLVLSRSGTPRVLAVYEDSNGDAQTTTLATLSGLNHAVKYRDGYVYASSDTTVYRWTYNGRNAMTNQETVITGIPGGGHSTRTIEFGKEDDWMYVSVGSNGNVDTNTARSRVTRISMNATTISSLPIAWSAMEVFADGLRNEVGLRIDPRNRLWGVENGMDNLARFSTTPALYITNPAEEVNIFTQESAGSQYGYPYCWSEGIGESGNQFSFQGGMGNGTVWAVKSDDSVYTDAWCRSQTIPCAWALQAHAAPLDIFFDEKRDLSMGPVAIIPQHGSWNRPSDFRAGYRVEYLHLDEQYNILSKEVLVQFPQDGSTRPVAGTRANCSSYDSCLFFTDDGAGRIFVVAKESSITPFAPSPTAGPELVPLQGEIIQVSDRLTVSWAIRDGVFSTSIVHSDATGWFAAGWNKERSMSGVAVLSTNGEETGTVNIDVRDEAHIMGSWNTESTNWGYYDMESRIQNGDQILSFKRPVECPEGADSSCFDIPIDGTTLSYFIWASHDDEIAYRSNSTLPRHTSKETYDVALFAQTAPTAKGAPADSSAGQHTTKRAIFLSFAFALLNLLIR
jgi:glucose/arabinose dehydrogenase